VTDVVVTVPARDEAATVGGTVRDLRRALRAARALTCVTRATIEVVAHRCRDATAAVAAEALGPDGGVTVDDTSWCVGQVRDLGVRRALARLGSPPADTWVLSTDADTRVGARWVVDVLAHARRSRVVGVVGLAPLDRWRGSPDGRAAYDRLLAAGLRAGDAQHQHDHVYGANLAVRADAYLAVGGFPAVPLGEDQALVDRLARTGHRLLRTSEITVRTSGRMAARAAGGLADHLAAVESSYGTATPRVGEPRSG
jgi:cellulose synthase/poly-beta-1,6-N-acetylglucosamine synthase-like glycosyltransferase